MTNPKDTIKKCNCAADASDGEHLESCPMFAPTSNPKEYAIDSQQPNGSWTCNICHMNRSMFFIPCDCETQKTLCYDSISPYLTAADIVETDENGASIPTEDKNTWEEDLRLKVRFDRNQDREVCILFIQRLLSTETANARADEAEKCNKHIEKSRNQGWDQGVLEGKERGRTQTEEKLILERLHSGPHRPH